MSKTEFTVKARITKTTQKDVAMWGGESGFWVEFYSTNGIDCRYKMGVPTVKQAQRVVDATEAGVIFTEKPTIKTDIHGEKYIDFDMKVFPKTLNYDLKRLGF